VLLSKATRLQKMAERVGTEKGRKNFATEYDTARDNAQDVIDLANDKRYGPFKEKSSPSELRNIDSIAKQAIKRSSNLADAKYTEFVERRKTEDRASGDRVGGGRGYVNPAEVKGMKSGGKVRGAGCATKGHGKGTMR
jgi:hypothetical protein